MKIRLFNLTALATWPLALVSGVSGLGGWLLGSASALPASVPLVLASAAPTQPAAPWPWPDSLDARRAAPQFHHVLLENERVRVLEVTVPPHQREPVHTHRWPSVIYRAAAPRGSGRYYDAAGQVLREFTGSPGPPSPPRAHWQKPEGPHAVENTGAVADRFIRVELKQ